MKHYYNPTSTSRIKSTEEYIDRYNRLFPECYFYTIEGYRQVLCCETTLTEQGNLASFVVVPDDSTAGAINLMGHTVLWREKATKKKLYSVLSKLTTEFTRDKVKSMIRDYPDVK